MAYSSSDDRRSRPRNRRGSGRSSQSRNSRSRNGQPSRDGSVSRKGTLQRPDTGYTLHSRRVRRESRLQTVLDTLLRPRVLLLIGLVIVVVVVLFMGVSTCINRNNEAAHATTEETKPKNDQDERVAAGISASMTSRFTQALDEGEMLAQIAANADQYDDDRLLLLALREPTSLKFVADYPTSDKSSSRYDGEIKRGEVPNLYNWDTHWGAVTYGDGPLAVTGSGPTTLAMAYMGLTGKSDFSPIEIAQQASKSNYAGNESGTKGEMFLKLTESMGLEVEAIDPSTDAFYGLGDNIVFAVELKPNTLTDEAHWVLVVNYNEDETVTVCDPTSTTVSARPWGMSQIANASTSFYSISATEDTLKGLGVGEEETTTTEGEETTKETEETEETEVTEEEYSYGY